MNFYEEYDFAGDGVPNAGDANSELQAGSQNAPLSPSSLRVTEDAAGGYAPLSQSSPSARIESIEATHPSVSRAGAGTAEETSSTFNGAAASSAPSTYTQDEWQEARANAEICKEFIRLTEEEKWSGNEAARSQGRSPSWFSGRNSMLARYRREGVAGCLPQRGTCGAKVKDLTAQIEALRWFIPAANFFYFKSNWQSDRGSLPDAITRTISLPHVPKGWTKREISKLLARMDLAALPMCPEDLRWTIEERHRNGKDLVPERVARQIMASRMAVEASRRPRGAHLKYVNAPGSLHLKLDRETLIERPIEPGERWTIDDGTVNFVACVPLQMPGNKCWEKFGCIVGRFQLLALADHRSYFIPGWSYTARPKGSYRAEDLTNTMHIGFKQHGVPREMALEHGNSASKLVHDALNGLNVRIDHVSSPHSKVIEFIFSPLWTRLSVIPGSVGRYGGDEEEINRLVESCRQGHTDPRKYFWNIESVLESIQEAVAWWNSHTVNSERYGRWQPANWFGRDAHKMLRPLDPKSSWLFSPFASKPLQVRGFEVKTTVPMMPGYSMTFTFGANELAPFHGRQVRLHFNPFASVCEATVVLAEDAPDARKGSVICTAPLTDRNARFGLRALGYSHQLDIGLEAMRSHAQAMRRSAAGVRTDGKIGAQSHEARNGLGDVVSVETGGAVQPRAIIVPELTEVEIAERKQVLTERTARVDRRFQENPLDYV